MKYSIKDCKQKPFINTFNKLCFGFYVVIIGLIIVATQYVSFYLINEVNNEIKSKNLQVEDILKNTKQLELNLEKEKKYIELINDIKASNINLKKSIKNILELVPDDIVLSEIILNKNDLLISGYTPSKESYNAVFAKALNSIFNTTNTKFIKNKNGYNFVSTNIIKNSEGFNE